MTNEELLRNYYAEHDEDAPAQLYEQNMDLLWSIARKSAKAFGCAESEFTKAATTKPKAS